METFKGDQAISEESKENGENQIDSSTDFYETLKHIHEMRYEFIKRPRFDPNAIF